ncbi:MAG: SPOR domain-containing protein [Deltaproteobacteria bacterium]|nr:SPOR domain-containing protein [Deltaproteobacteria bacterium]
MKRLIGLGLAAVIIALAIIYFYYPGSAPQVGPGKPEKPEVMEPKEKVPPREPAAPAPQQPKLPLPERVGPSEKPSPPPEPSLKAPPETVLPPLEPQEKYGLLIRSYTNYADAAKMMEKLQKQGHQAFIRQEKGKYQVWVGPFATQKEAEAAKKSLKAKLKIAAKIQKVVEPVPK